MKRRVNFARTRCPAYAALALVWAGLFYTPVFCQIFPPDVAAKFNEIVGNRIEALSILGGDYGISGGFYSVGGDPQRNVDLSLLKMGGGGEFGEKRPLGSLGISWQPRLLGALGYLEAKDNFKGGLLGGDESKYKTFALQVGGGARFWFGDHLSLAPTIAGMYGHSENSYDANSQFARTNFEILNRTGLINWTANTWSVNPGADLQYEYSWRRTIFTLSSTFSYYHTESFDTTTPNLDIVGDSEMWRNKIDVDVPLGLKLLGYELRSGGYFSRTELFGNIQEGLRADHIYEIHGRLVLDLLGKFWKLRWLGLGGSYLWGPGFDGWAIGGDVRFQF